MITKLTDYNIRHCNTFRMDVQCREWIEYTEASDLPAVFDSLDSSGYMAIGAGSNLLFLCDYDGALLHSRILDVEMIRLDADAVIVRAGAGVEMDVLIRQTCEAGLWGLENLSGIPGEVGASAVQNVGAYGVEAKDVIDSVECYDVAECRFVTLSAEECDFGYRMSRFKTEEYKGRYIVTYVNFRLQTKPNPVLEYGNLKSRVDLGGLTPVALRDAVVEMRMAKLPSVEQVGSAGSFFKNPVISESAYTEFLSRVKKYFGEDVVVPHFNVPGGIKLSAAWLIDKSGLKGKRNGDAATWPTQPLVIVNTTGKASAKEIVGLEQEIVTTVKETFGVELTPEVEHIGII